jgi:hypothetical protein
LIIDDHIAHLEDPISYDEDGEDQSGKTTLNSSEFLKEKIAKAKAMQVPSRQYAPVE